MSTTTTASTSYNCTDPNCKYYRKNTHTVTATATGNIVTIGNGILDPDDEKHQTFVLSRFKLVEDLKANKGDYQKLKELLEQGTQTDSDPDTIATAPTTTATTPTATTTGNVAHNHDHDDLDSHTNEDGLYDPAEYDNVIDNNDIF